MVRYWTSFARDGAPCAAGPPEWRPYVADRVYMDFDDAPHVLTHLLPGMYELHEEVVCRRRAHGGIPWNWNVGVMLPTQAQVCR